MYEKSFEDLRKATDAAIQVQQEMFWSWANFWAGKPDEVKALQKNWVETYGELLKKQQETLEAQFKSGLKMIKDAFPVSTTASTEEVRGKLIEDWKKNFESHRQMVEAQMHSLQTAVAQWTDQATKPMTMDWWLTGG